MNELTARTDRSLIRAAGGSVRHVAVTLVAPVSDRDKKRPPVDVAFVLDRSGSMAGEKIELARDAILQGIAMLQPADRFAVVAYDNSIDVVMPLTPAHREARENAEAQLRLDRLARQHEPLGRLAGRLPAAGRGPEPGAGRPLPADVRRTGQRRHHRPAGAGTARPRTAAARRGDVHVRRGRGLRRAADERHGARRRRPRLLHPGRPPDRRPADERAGRVAGGRRARGVAVDPRAKGREGGAAERLRCTAGERDDDGPPGQPGVGPVDDDRPQGHAARGRRGRGGRAHDSSRRRRGRARCASGGSALDVGLARAQRRTAERHGGRPEGREPVCGPDAA